jgi:hypothetical protein
MISRKEICRVKLSTPQLGKDLTVELHGAHEIVDAIVRQTEKGDKDHVLLVLWKMMGHRGERLISPSIVLMPVEEFENAVEDYEHAQIAQYIG